MSDVLNHCRLRFEACDSPTSPGWGPWHLDFSIESSSIGAGSSRGNVAVLPPPRNMQRSRRLNWWQHYICLLIGLNTASAAFLLITIIYYNNYLIIFVFVWKWATLEIPRIQFIVFFSRIFPTEWPSIGVAFFRQTHLGTKWYDLARWKMPHAEVLRLEKSCRLLLEQVVRFGEFKGFGRSTTPCHVAIINYP